MFELLQPRVAQAVARRLVAQPGAALALAVGSGPAVADAVAEVDQVVVCLGRAPDVAEHLALGLNQRFASGNRGLHRSYVLRRCPRLARPLIWPGPRPWPTSLNTV